MDDVYVLAVIVLPTIGVSKVDINSTGKDFVEFKWICNA